jgi:hypothetical protein
MPSGIRLAFMMISAAMKRDDKILMFACAACDARSTRLRKNSFRLVAGGVALVIVGVAGRIAYGKTVGLVGVGLGISVMVGGVVLAIREVLMFPVLFGPRDDKNAMVVSFQGEKLKD